jgi:hypothetical protein
MLFPTYLVYPENAFSGREGLGHFVNPDHIILTILITLIRKDLRFWCLRGRFKALSGSKHHCSPSQARQFLLKAISMLRRIHLEGYTLQHASACVSMRQHASAYVSIRQHTSPSP